MGGIKRKRKKIETPGHPYDKARLERELPLVGSYGLRNKRELWKARTILTTARQQARRLLALDPEAREIREQELLSRLSRFGMLSQNSNLDSVLGLEIKVVLERRLQTIVFRKGLASSPYQARQFIAHRHIAIGTGVATSPSRLITVAEEELVNYAPRSPLNDQTHPSRPQAPPAFDAGQPEKKEEPKRERTGRDGKPRRKEAPKAEVKKEAPKPEVKKEAPKKEVKTIPEVKKEVPKKEVPKKEAPKPSAKTIPEVKKEAPKKEAKTADLDISLIKGIGAKTAMLLKESGFDTVGKIAKATTEELSKVPGVGPATASAMNSEAKVLLSKKAEDKK